VHPALSLSLGLAKRQEIKVGAECLSNLEQRHAALIQRGLTMHDNGKFREAESFYQAVLKENPKHPDGLNLMGILAVEAKQHRFAIDYIAKAVKLVPNQPIYVNNLGNAHLLYSEPEKALPLFRKAVRLSPRYPILRKR
jgi:Flp pilus assembly protein TadD